MIWLAAHMWFLMFAAFFVGLTVGWGLWAKRAEKRSRPDTGETMGSLAFDFAEPSDEDDAR